MRGGRRRLGLRALDAAPLLLYIAVVVVFSALSPGFLAMENLTNVVVQASTTAVMAVGITFVLLGAGIDLSVGSVMLLASAVAGSLVVHGGWSPAPAMGVMLLVGAGIGLANGLLVTRLRLAPFIVTLSMLFVARGAGLWITQTRAINLPDGFRVLATARLAGVPTPVWILAVVLGLAHLTLSRTSFGRQLAAVGNDVEAARTAGLSVDGILLRAYVVCGVCAGLGGAIALAQLSAVSPNMGQGRELDVIAAAVLGGTSLFGGRGTAHGSVLGAVLVETVRAGLNVVDADPYLYPVVTGSFVFAAVFLDSLRQQHLARTRRPRIRPESA